MNDRTPNAETQAAIADAEAGGLPRFGTVEELMANLNATCEQCEDSTACLSGTTYCDLCGEFIADVPRATANAVLERLQKAHAAMRVFCDRVEKGEVRSKRTYAQFCELLGRELKQ